MIKAQLAVIVSEALTSAHAAGQIGPLPAQLLAAPIIMERPRHPEHGHLSCAVAIQLAAQAGSSINAMELAQILVSHIQARCGGRSDIAQVRAAHPGFINFTLRPSIGAHSLLEIGRLAGDFGRSNNAEGKRVMLSCELPQEPLELTVDQARLAVYGDSLARLLRFSGLPVDQEISLLGWVQGSDRSVAGRLLLLSLGVDITEAKVVNAAGRGKAKMATSVFAPDAGSASLASLIDTLGPCTLRFCFVSMGAGENAAPIDLALARKTSPVNPAFWVQYAYVRCGAILRQVREPHVNILSSRLAEANLSREQWEAFLMECTNSLEIYSDWRPKGDDNLDADRCQADLILKLASFPEEVEAAAYHRQPERVARYALDLAHGLTTYCQHFNLGEGLFCSDLSVLKARLGLIFATKQVLSNALGIIGLSAPERM